MPALASVISLNHPTAEPSTAASVSLLGLEKRFAGREVLKALTLDIARGSFVSIVGRSGCGKTTLLRIIAGLEKPDGGEVAIACDDGARSGDVRMMFQDARLLPWQSVVDNVRLGMSKRALPMAMEALRQVGLEDRASDWPAILSGGQRQRVALARALVHQPQLLLLDEPLGALDALTRIEMQELIEGLWLKNRFTTVLVTHDVHEAVALADRVIVMGNGTILSNSEVDLPRPRAQSSREFAALQEHILRQVLLPAAGPLVGI
jgi:sulfonate transport system ATP-binding protein